MLYSTSHTLGNESSLLWDACIRWMPEQLCALRSLLNLVAKGTGCGETLFSPSFPIWPWHTRGKVSLLPSSEIQGESTWPLYPLDGGRRLRGYSLEAYSQLSRRWWVCRPFHLQCTWASSYRRPVQEQRQRVIHQARLACRHTGPHTGSWLTRLAWEALGFCCWFFFFGNNT